jgi:ATP-binding cassette subfamily B multidrug efflux pump
MSDTPTPSQAPQKSAAWRELRALVRPWRGLIAVIAVCVLLTEAFAVVPSLLIKRIVDDHLTRGIQEGILALALLYLGAMAAAQGMDFVVTYLTARVAQGALRDLRVHLFAHLQRLPLAYYDQTPLGDVISRCTTDVETVDTLFTTGVSRLITRLVQLLVAAAAMAALSPRLAIPSLLLIPPLALVTRFFQVNIRDAERERRQAIGLLNVYLQETLSGVEVVRAFGREDAFVARFGLALRETVRAYGRSLSFNVFYTPLLTVLVALSIALLLWLGAGGLGQNWGLSMGTLTAFILLFQRFFEPIRNLGEDWQTVQSALSGIERIVQVLDIPAEKAPTLAASDAPLRGDSAVVELRQVVFGYLADLPVLHGVTLTVWPGEHVALVGRTGGGKSSAMHLLAGLHAPWSGQVRVAGLDPRALPDDERRRVVGVVPQMVQLFSGTVLENLTLGDMSAERERIEQAAKMATVDRFVSALPQGYDTLLGGAGRGEGVQLSEGQQQLLSLARALVWDPAVLLLDEATAAVDNASEAEFQAALRAAMQEDVGRGRAVVTVAHRLSTAREADRVIVLEEGRIVEEGAPEELIRRGGKFAALVELEAAGWDWRRSL